MSTSCRFHQPASFSPQGLKRQLRKRKRRPTPNPTPIGVDCNFITDGHESWPLDSLPDTAEANFMTLTRREADLVALANPGRLPPVALEEIQPWLPNSKFVPDAVVNYNNLRRTLRKYRSHLFSAGDASDQMWNTIVNRIRTKTDCDMRFFSAWHLPIQEAYVFTEKRLNRSVIAVDFNSMYPACMQQKFPDPSRLHTVVYERQFVSGEILPFGLFRCSLEGPSSDFIKEHNPFRSFFAGRYLKASLNETLKLDLNEFEIYYYSQHFSRIYIHDSVISEGFIHHPLAREAQRCYAKRLNYIQQGNKALADREKFRATLLSSCAQRPKRWKRKTSNFDALEMLLSRFLGFCALSDGEIALAKNWQTGKNGIKTSHRNDNILIDSTDVFCDQSVLMFNQRIVALSRVKILSEMENIKTYSSDIEICYSNIDSIHFSVPSSVKDMVLQSLMARVSSRMGGIKIDTVSSSGLWLEPGRYWLYKDKLDKSRNRGIRHTSGPFSDYSIHVSNRMIGNMNIPIRYRVNMNRTISDASSLLDADSELFVRQSLIEISSQAHYNCILSALEKNRKISVPQKVRAFENLKLKLENITSRCFET